MLAEHFLHYRVWSLPFMYLGLQVGENPHREQTWKPLLVSRRLNSWGNKYVSYGGMVVLLNFGVGFLVRGLGQD